jgi:hypothetical protein
MASRWSDFTDRLVGLSILVMLARSYQSVCLSVFVMPMRTHPALVLIRHPGNLQFSLKLAFSKMARKPYKTRVSGASGTATIPIRALPALSPIRACPFSSPLQVLSYRLSFIVTQCDPGPIRRLSFSVSQLWAVIMARIL